MTDLTPADLSRLLKLHIHVPPKYESANVAWQKGHSALRDARLVTITRNADWPGHCDIEITQIGLRVADAMIAAGMAAVPLSPVDAILDQSAPGMRSLRELGWGPGSDEGT